MGLWAGETDDAGDGGCTTRPVWFSYRLEVDYQSAQKAADN